MSKEAFDKLENRILSRLDPQDRRDVRSLLRNVTLFIRRIERTHLSEGEKNYPSHPLFSHRDQKGGQNTAETLRYRLQFVDRFHIDKKQYIIDVLTQNVPMGGKKQLSTRKAQILWQLFQDPIIPKYQIAKKIGTTPRTVSKDLTELEQDYALRVFTNIDPHKFHLTMRIIMFETYSFNHTKKLEKFVSNHRGFLLYFRLDQDMRQGTVTFRYPDQPNGHQMFEKRYSWLNDEFFKESYQIQALGLYQSISFEMYNPTIHAFSIEPEIVSQVPFDYSRQSIDTLPQPRGFDFTEPFDFDQADFLLSGILYSSGPLTHPEYKQNLLARFGINYSMKTIWKKQQRLRKEKAGYPMIELQIPGFDEDMMLVVFCTPKATSAIRAISAFLPSVMFINTNSGCLLRIQRPVHTSALTGQLIRKIHNQQGVTDVKLLRYKQRLQTPLLPAIVDRWNAAEQEWQLEEGDI